MLSRGAIKRDKHNAEMALYIEQRMLADELLGLERVIIGQ